MKQPKFPHSVRIKEVGPRDGLQNENVSIPSRAKVQLIRDLVAAGSTYIESTAFVSPQAIPQLADADRVARQLPRRRGVTFAALVPNMRGMERALAAGIDEVAVFTAASDSFNRRNINATITESFDRFRPVLAAARRERIRVRGYVSTAWECPYEGLMPPGRVIPVVETLLDMGCYEVSLGDTIGHATPTSVWRLFDRLLRKIPKRKLAAQFHDTRSAALANTLAAMQYGIRTFDSAVGGLGGCPYAPGASGNLATEDLVCTLDGMGVKTGLSLRKLVQASSRIARHLDHPLTSRVYQSEIARQAR
jgi:isopropylmalate/homocitrate/citramalate synthase